MITSAERERIIKALALAVDRAGVGAPEAISALEVVARFLAARNCTLADALIDREALALLEELRAAAGTVPIDPITFDG